jgi:hypothetical protein
METFKRLIIIGVLAAFGPVAAQAQSNPTSAESRLANFSRIAKAAGESISFITSDGMVREGLLVSASADAITMKFAGGEQVFSKSTIASVERMRDTPRPPPPHDRRRRPDRRSLRRTSWRAVRGRWRAG